MGSLAKTMKIPNHAAIAIVATGLYLSLTLSVMFFEQRIYNVLGPMLYVGVAVLLFMTVVFLVSRLIKRMDLIDAGWGSAFIVAALAAFVIGDNEFTEGLTIQLLVLALVGVWGTRLTVMILQRISSHPEDKRYVEIRNEWKGSVAINSYFRIFVLQAALATLVSIGVIHIMFSPEQGLGVWSAVGVIVWIVGFIFESVGDWQLRQFVRNPKNKGKLMSKGLWRYTRHPNYFGEATMWWGVFIIALDTPYGWVAIATPLIITYLLLFISGVPLAEKALSKKPGWKEYKKKTSLFIPTPPSK